MINTYRILPVYTGDVSGVASALYELGGMVVIHDPSGCNSTYNTHDEVRWYDRESAIYISGLSELDAILGNDRKFIDDIMLAADELSPRFIAICSSPIPYLNGTDFEGIAKLIEKKSGIPTFYVSSNGMHDYSTGVSKAMLALAKKFVKKVSSDKKQPGVNIIGLTPLDVNGDVTELFETYSEYSILSSFCMGASLEDIMNASRATLNIVTSVTGIETAVWMQEEFGIPYIIKRNITEADKGLIKRQEHLLISSAKSKRLCLVGEPVYMTALSDYMASNYALDCQVVNPLEITVGNVTRTSGEEDVEEVLSTADIVLGDPLYQCVCSEKTFIRVPHLAFSGRIFMRELL